MDRWLKEAALKTGLFIPTLNPGIEWQQWIKGLKSQTFQPKRVLIIDSSSYDGTVRESLNQCFEVRLIPRYIFNHGGTRQLAAEILHDMDFIVYMTQDAILANSQALEELVDPFRAPSIAASYGQQLPKQGASLSASALRDFNYPKESRVQTFNDRKKLGIKAAFLSNSFSAYRRSALTEVGGFPRNSLVSEDMYISALLLQKDYGIKYQASAQVFHSHDFNRKEQFQRYFDIGVFHHRERWIRDLLGSTESEGLRFLTQQLAALGLERFYLAPSVIFDTAIKFIAYRIGLLEKNIPLFLKRLFSCQKAYWSK